MIIKYNHAHTLQFIKVASVCLSILASACFQPDGGANTNVKDLRIVSDFADALEAEDLPGESAPQTPLTPSTDPDLPTVHNLANRTSSVGTNVGWFKDWSTQWVFVDQFMRSAEWFSRGRNSDGSCLGPWENHQPLTFDSNGWPVTATADSCPQTYFFIEGGFPAGTYVMLYEGEGGVQIRGATNIVRRPGRITFSYPGQGLIAVALDPVPRSTTNYNIKNMRLIMPGGVCGTSETALNFFSSCATPRGGTGSCSAQETCFDFEQVAYNRFRDPVSAMNNPKLVFHPSDMSSMRRYSAVRYMNWTETNGNTLSQWSERIRPEFYTHVISGKGMAYEFIAAMSNLLHADPWINVPHMATNDYVLKMAQLFRQHLDPRLKLHIEYSNEAWNGQFPQTQWMKQREIDLRMTQDYGVNFFAQRTGQVMDIFKSVFPEPNRIVRIMGAWAAHEGQWTARLLASGNAYQKVDAAAIAPYFAGEFHEVINGTPITQGMTLNQIFQEIFTGGVFSPTSRPLLENAQRYIEQNVATTNRYGVQLMAYEGGQHMVQYSCTCDYAADATCLARSPHCNSDVLFRAANLDQRMGDAYYQYFQRWRTAGGTLFMHFVHVDKYSQHGYFGTLQSSNESSSPKFDAINRFMHDVRCWWAGCEKTY